MRFLLVPLIVLLSALSFLRLDDFRRWDAFGWTAPAMDEHWMRLYRERTQHAAKNVLVEWTRIDPQRAAKLFSFVILVLFGLLIAAILIR